MNVIRTKVVPRFVALCTDSVQRAFLIFSGMVDEPEMRSTEKELVCDINI